MLRSTDYRYLQEGAESLSYRRRVLAQSESAPTMTLLLRSTLSLRSCIMWAAVVFWLVGLFQLACRTRSYVLTLRCAQRNDS